MDKTIWLSPPHMSGNELKYIEKAFNGNWIAPAGPNIDGFESDIKNFLKSPHEVVALNSGTSAIHLALILLGVSDGDEVLCQSFTFSASANPILYTGAKPIFIDSESDTWNMCPSLLEEAIIDRIRKGKKPKAIIAVHLYGMPCKMYEIRAISEKYGIPIVEDAAEALGSTIEKMPCGIFGDLGVFSFNGNKIITTSGGGALITRDLEEKQKAVHLATQAKDNAVHFEHTEVGYNFRMSNISAGIGRGQMEVLNERVLKKREIFESYKELLKDTELQFQQEPDSFYSNRWLTCILTDGFQQRERIRIELSAYEIESRPLWKPLHMQPVFKDCLHYTNGTSEAMFNVGLCLPSGTALSYKQQGEITSIIKKSIRT